MEVVLKNVRLSFPDLFTAKAFQNEEPKFGATFLINKNDEVNLGILREAFKEVIKNSFPNGAPKGLKLCINDGDQKEYDGYAGHQYIRASTKKRPHVVNRDGKTPISEADGIVYAGCYVNVSMNIWAQDNSYGKRINASLNGVQFVADGGSFGNAFDPSASFPELPPTQGGETFAHEEAPGSDVATADLLF